MCVEAKDHWFGVNEYSAVGLLCCSWVQLNEAKGEGWHRVCLRGIKSGVWSVTPGP